jgi:anthranilate phosphoribosyltransferase
MSLSAAAALDLAKTPSGMNAEQTVEVLSLLTSATLKEAEGAQILKAWAGRGESGVELAAAVRHLKRHAVQVPVEVDCFDLCGTGGSGLTRYNISTTVAFVAAAAGVPVAKHGNRGSRRPNGSFDLLDELGVPFDLTPAQEAELVSGTGLCFLFARTHHPTVAKVVPYRKAAGCRTIFNLAGPLANPARIKHQIIGTVDEATALVVSDALHELQTEGALVVWGEPGIDEISVTGKTGYFQVGAAGHTAGSFDTPRHPDVDYSALPGGDAAENARLFRDLLSGEHDGPLLDMLCISAGAAIDLWRGSPPAYEGPGAKVARTLIADGSAYSTFEAHRALATKLARS